MVALGMMSLLFIISATTTSNTIAAACLMLCYFFIPVNGINYFSACIDIGRSKAGTVAGIINFSGSMGAFFLAIVFGKIVDVTHSFNAPLFVVAGVLFIGCLMWLVVDPTKKIAAEESINKAILQYQ